MAGELTHIIPTHPSDPNYRASKTRGITWCDANGVAHTITAVYWSPTNNVNDRKLIWQLSNDVPYDNTCTATITLSQDKTAWIVTVTKDGEDVTSSLSQITTWIYDKDGTRVNPQRVYTNIIDLSNKPRGDYRVDLAQITSKAGGYFPSTGSISVPEHIYIGQIVAGSQNVAIEYVPTEDITVNSIEIFTSQTTSSTSGLIKILYENGLFVGAIDGNNEDAITERYHLTGRPRTVSNVGVSLYAGKKYYIVFQDSNNSTYYPTYFQNETGNYKVYANTTAASQITIYPDAISLKATIGHDENLNNSLRDAILNLNANEKFLWGGYPQQEINPKTPAMVTNGVYNRETLTGSYSGKKTTLAGIASTPKNDYCLIDVNDTGFTNESVYRKTTDIPSYTEFNFDSYTSLSQDEKQIMYIASLNNKTLFVTSTHSWVDYYDIRGLNKFKTGYTSDIEIVNNVPTARTTEPDNPTNKCFYYLNTSTHSSGLYLYENSTYTAFHWWDTGSVFSNYIEISQLISYFTVINFSTIISFVVQPSYDYTFAHTTLSTDKKFYLKINGKEV